MSRERKKSIRSSRNLKISAIRDCLKAGGWIENPTAPDVLGIRYCKRCHYSVQVHEEYQELGSS